MPKVVGLRMDRSFLLEWTRQFNPDKFQGMHYGGPAYHAHQIGSTNYQVLKQKSNIKRK